MTVLGLLERALTIAHFHDSSENLRSKHMLVLETVEHGLLTSSCTLLIYIYIERERWVKTLYAKTDFHRSTQPVFFLRFIKRRNDFWLFLY